MRTLFHECKLVHADLSEYNMLYKNKTLYIIDVSQSVEHDHPNAFDFLRMDCGNVNRYFKNNGVLTLSNSQLYKFIITNPSDIPNGDVDTFLDSLLDDALEREKRGGFTQDEEIAERVFEQAHIPRSLEEVEDVERELKRAQENDGAALYETLRQMAVHDKAEVTVVPISKPKTAAEDLEAMAQKLKQVEAEADMKRKALALARRGKSKKQLKMEKQEEEQREREEKEYEEKHKKQNMGLQVGKISGIIAFGLQYNSAKKKRQQSKEQVLTLETMQEMYSELRNVNNDDDDSDDDDDEEEKKAEAEAAAKAAAEAAKAAENTTPTAEAGATGTQAKPEPKKKQKPAKPGSKRYQEEMRLKEEKERLQREEMIQRIKSHHERSAHKAVEEDEIMGLGRDEEEEEAPELVDITKELQEMTIVASSKAKSQAGKEHVSVLDKIEDEKRKKKEKHEEMKLKKLQMLANEDDEEEEEPRAPVKKGKKVKIAPAAAEEEEQPKKKGNAFDEAAKLMSLLEGKSDEKPKKKGKKSLVDADEEEEEEIAAPVKAGKTKKKNTAAEEAAKLMALKAMLEDSEDEDAEDEDDDEDDNDSDEEDVLAWAKLGLKPNGERMTDEEIRALKKAHKARVKEANRIKRANKLKKKDKKRQIKTSQPKKK